MINNNRVSARRWTAGALAGLMVLPLFAMVPIAVAQAADTTPPVAKIVSPEFGSIGNVVIAGSGAAANVWVTITPDQNARLIVAGTDTMQVTATASDDVGVTSVAFTVDFAEDGVDTTGPDYTYDWNLDGARSGNRLLRACAFDAAGNAGCDSRVITLVAL